MLISITVYINNRFLEMQFSPEKKTLSSRSTILLYVLSTIIIQLRNETRGQTKEKISGRINNKQVIYYVEQLNNVYCMICFCGST